MKGFDKNFNISYQQAHRGDTVPALRLNKTGPLRRHMSNSTKQIKYTTA